MKSFHTSTFFDQSFRDENSVGQRIIEIRIFFESTNDDTINDERFMTQVF